MLRTGGRTSEGIAKSDGFMSAFRQQLIFTDLREEEVDRILGIEHAAFLFGVLVREDQMEKMRKLLIDYMDNALDIDYAWEPRYTNMNRTRVCDSREIGRMIAEGRDMSMLDFSRLFLGGLNFGGAGGGADNRSGIRIRDSDFSYSNLAGASFELADIRGTVLRGTSGLEAVRFYRTRVDNEQASTIRNAMELGLKVAFRRS